MLYKLTDLCHIGLLVEEEVGLAPHEDLGAPLLAMGHDRQDVPHRPAQHVHRVLHAENVGQV